MATQNEAQLLSEEKASLKISGQVSLLSWSQKDSTGCLERPYNSHEIFSAYAKATGNTFEDTLMLAAQALLGQWREENSEILLSSKNDAEHTSLYEDEELRALIRDKVQFNIGSLPRFVAEIYQAQCQSEGMNKREYFYHLLREQGGVIPPYLKMDGRKL